LARGDRLQSEILAVLRRHVTPMSAYELLARLKENRPKLAPPTIYRGLAALVAQGRVHRLESLNAFMACQRDWHPDPAILSICGACGHVEETVAPELLRKVSRVAGKSGFKPERHVIELHGRCGACAATEARA